LTRCARTVLRRKPTWKRCGGNAGSIAKKRHLWEFLERQGLKRGPVEIYGEMELVRLLDRFLDRALCFAIEGYEQHSQLQD